MAVLVWVSGASVARAEPPPLPPPLPAEEAPPPTPAPEPAPVEPPTGPVEPPDVSSTPPEALPPAEQPPAAAPPEEPPPSAPPATAPSPHPAAQTVAAAQTVTAAPDREPDASTDRSSLVLPDGALAFGTTIEVGHIDFGEYGSVNPVVFAPDVWYGASDHFTFGAVTSTVALTGFWTRSRPSGLLCMSSNCDGPTVGGEGIIALLRGDVELAPTGGIDIVHDGVFAKIGLKALGHLARLSASASPSLLVKLADTDEPYERVVRVPVDLTLEVAPILSLGVQSGFEWIEFADGWDLDNMYTVPVGVAASVNASRSAIVSLAFAFDHAAQSGMEPVDMGVASQWSIAASLMTVIR